MDVKFIHQNLARRRRRTPDLETLAGLEAKARSIFGLGDHPLQLSYIDCDSHHIALLENLDVTHMLESQPRNRQFVEVHIEVIRESDFCLRNAEVYKKKLLLELQRKYQGAPASRRAELTADLRGLGARLRAQNVQPVFVERITDDLAREMTSFFLSNLIEYDGADPEESVDREVQDYFEAVSVSQIDSRTDFDFLNSNLDHSDGSEGKRDSDLKLVLAEVTEGGSKSPKSLSPIEMRTPLREGLAFFSTQVVTELDLKDDVGTTEAGKTDADDESDTDSDAPPKYGDLTQPFVSSVGKLGNFLSTLRASFAQGCSQIQQIFK